MLPTKVNSRFVSALAAQLLEHYDAAAESALSASVYEAKSVETISTKIAEQIGRCDRSYGFTEMALEIGERHADPLYFDAYEKL